MVFGGVWGGCVGWGDLGGMHLVGCSVVVWRFPLDPAEPAELGGLVLPSDLWFDPPAVLRPRDPALRLGDPAINRRRDSAPFAAMANFP